MGLVERAMDARAPLLGCGCGTIPDRSWPWRSSSVVEQGTHKPPDISAALFLVEYEHESAHL